MSSSKNLGYRPSRSNVDLVTSVLRSVTESVRTWNDDDLAAFLAGERDLTISAPTRTARKRGRAVDDVRSQVEDVRAAFDAMNTREEGIEYLEHMALSRDSLRAVVAALDLPVNRSDNMERLRNRVVEGLIGYRLRSKAIRGDRRPKDGQAQE
jgi:hypothetical protein